MWFSWFGYGTTTPQGPQSPVEYPTNTICAPAATKRRGVLGEVVVDLARGDRGAQVAVATRVVDVDVEPVLVGGVLVHPAAVPAADVADDDTRRLRVRDR